MSEPPKPSKEFLTLWGRMFPGGDFRSQLILSRVRYMGSGIRWVIVRFFYDLWPKFTKIIDEPNEELGTVERKEIIDIQKIYEALNGNDKELKEDAELFLKYYSYLQQIFTIQLQMSPYLRDAAMRLFNTLTFPKIEAQYLLQSKHGGGVSPFYEPTAEITETTGNEFKKKTRRQYLEEELEE